MLPSGRFGGGPAQAGSTGAGRFWIFRRRLASPVTKSCGALASCWACSVFVGSTERTEPRTLFGR